VFQESKSQNTNEGRFVVSGRRNRTLSQTREIPMSP
jgi:hypothetical protein